MTTYTTFEADGIDFLCTVTFDASPGATTLDDGEVKVDAINKATNAKFAGTATIASATTIRCTFASWSLVAGTYSVQVRATPVGYAAQTVADSTFRIQKSAGVAP